MISKAPRTDAAVVAAGGRINAMEDDFINADFARTLERALNLAREDNAALRASLRHLANNVNAYFSPGYDDRHYYRDEKKLREMADAALERVDLRTY